MLSTLTQRVKDKFLCNSIISQPNSKELKCRKCAHRFFLSFAGKIGSEFSDWTTGTKRSASLAANRISIFSQFSNYRSVLGIGIRCDVCHATTSGTHTKKRILNEINFPLSTNQPQFTFSRLYHHLILHFTFTFPCSETLAKLFYRSDPFRPSEQQIPFKHSFIHSFIH